MKYFLEVVQKTSKELESKLTAAKLKLDELQDAYSKTKDEMIKDSN